MRCDACKDCMTKQREENGKLQERIDELEFRLEAERRAHLSDNAYWMERVEELSLIADPDDSWPDVLDVGP